MEKRFTLEPRKSTPGEIEDLRGGASGKSTEGASLSREEKTTIRGVKCRGVGSFCSPEENSR